MDIFLTGGTGFIGSHFIERALRRSHNLKALKRSKKSKVKIILKDQPVWLIKNFSEIEISDLKNYEVLVHMAAHSANFPYDNLENCLYFNVTETLRLFNIAYSAGIRNFVITGSCFEYGKKGEDYQFIPPDAALFPTQTYPTSKAVCSLVLTQWALEKKVNLKILRLFQVYGEGELSSRLWPTLKEKALRGENLRMTFGEQIRDFSKVEDIADKVLDEAINIKEKSIIIKNIGSGIPVKLKDFVSEAWDKLHAKGKIELGSIPYRKNEIMRYVPDTKSEYILR